MTQSEMLQLLQQLKQAYAGQESPDERYKFAAAAIDDAISTAVRHLEKRANQ